MDNLRQKHSILRDRSTTLRSDRALVCDAAYVSAVLADEPDCDLSVGCGMRKFDTALLLLLSTLYLFDRLDCLNIGKIYTKLKEKVMADGCSGHSSEMGPTPDDLNLAVSLFSVTFMLLQLPSAAMEGKQKNVIMMVRLTVGLRSGML